MQDIKKTIRDLQVERAKKMPQSGNIKKERRNPNDPARFVGKTAVTEDGEAADIRHYLDTDKIEDEALYDGMYAVTTDLLDDDVKRHPKKSVKGVGKLKNVSAS